MAGMIDAASVPKAALDRLMPMHLILAADGTITGHGPTLAKLTGDRGLLGRTLFEAFDLRRPAGLVSMADLLTHQGEKLRLALRGAVKPLTFRGLAQMLGDGQGMVVNLSFGIGVVDAVRSLSLTDSDFAATDLTIEMMYLVEAKAAAEDLLQGLAERLEGDKQKAQAQALTDTLTGLRNRRALSMTLDGLTQSLTPFALLHVDLDYFKAVNDTLGHAAGDHVLQVVAEVLRRETRLEDTIARVGGDEFVLVFPEQTDPKQLDGIARRIIAQLSNPITFEGRDCRISASIGIALSTEYDQPSPEKMQSDADSALYASKRAGRGRAQLFKTKQKDRRRA